jgi:hypothetical protein
MIRLGSVLAVALVVAGCGSTQSPVRSTSTPGASVPLIDTRDGTNTSVALSAFQATEEGRPAICLHVVSTRTRGGTAPVRQQQQCYPTPLPARPLFLIAPACSDRLGGVILGLAPATDTKMLLQSGPAKHGVRHTAIPPNALGIQGVAFAGYLRLGMTELVVSAINSPVAERTLVGSVSATQSCGPTAAGKPLKPTGP